MVEAITSVTGTYRLQITGVTGTYALAGGSTDWWTVGFHDCTTGIDADQWWNGKHGGAGSSFGAVPIHIGLGQAVTGIDADMHAGGSLSGTVRSLASGSAHLPGGRVGREGRLIGTRLSRVLDRGQDLPARGVDQ